MIFRVQDTTFISTTPNFVQGKNKFDTIDKILSSFVKINI